MTSVNETVTFLLDSAAEADASYQDIHPKQQKRPEKNQAQSDHDCLLSTILSG